MIMDSDAFLDQEYENLNDAILQAIVESKAVQDILARFKKLSQMDDKAVLNLFLSLDELHQMIKDKSSNSANYKLEPSETQQETIEQENKATLKDTNLIDGQVLTINEVLFEKYFQRKFDENSWMKKARIRF